MKTYIGVKIVQAEIQSKDGKEGFRVVYSDTTNDNKGYESWCPKDVFLFHNRPVDGMPFGYALEAARLGKKAARKGWNGRGDVYLPPAGKRHSRQE